MNNLGLYQWITATAKKVGGPLKFLVIVGGTGYVIIRPIEAGVKTVIKKAFKKLSSKNEFPVYEVETYGKSNDGVEFKIGDLFRVLDSDGDAVLIEIIDNPNNPYFVSADFLRTISKYPNE